MRGLLKASHFGPTLIVTSISLAFALYYWPIFPALQIAMGVFLGQLIVGWSNDLHDYADDLRHNRLNKPLIAREISKETLGLSLKLVLPIAILANIFGPLGLHGGALYIFGVGCGVAYNFYFKYSALSPLPYALAFAALPSCIAISKDVTPPTWMWLGGAIFGVSAHFINVLKDMDQDRISGIGGLPQRIGKKGSIAIAIALIAVGVALLSRDLFSL
jgi:4-hydroxybenzoate polyprenyltransferase